MFQPNLKHELMLSDSTDDFERNPKLVDSLLTLSFKDDLLSNIKDKALFDILDKYIIVQVEKSLNWSKERKRDINLTQTIGHTYFNPASISALGSKLDIVIKNEAEIIENGAEIKKQNEAILRKLDGLIKSVDNMSILVKHCNGLLGFPMNFIIIPLRDKDREENKVNLKNKKDKKKKDEAGKKDNVEKKSWFTWEGLKTNASKTGHAVASTVISATDKVTSTVVDAKDKVLRDTGMEVEVPCVFICEGCISNPEIPCKRTSDGFKVTLPGK